MSQRLVIDCRKFSFENKRIDGFLALQSFDRLNDQLCNAEGTVHYVLSGFLGRDGRVCFELEISGQLSLVCQRCLGPVAFPLDVKSSLELVPEGFDLALEPLEDDDKDFLPWTKTLDVGLLVEDEIILALPAVAKHPSCVLQGPAEGSTVTSPFVGLATLKSGLH